MTASRVRFEVIVAVVALAARAAFADCDPTGADAADVAAARAAIARSCQCATASSHRAYTRCASLVAKVTLANPDCRRAVEDCATHSTCGRTDAVACCRTSGKGVTRCGIKSNAGRCKAPRNGSACVGSASSCCDACESGGGCVTTTTTLPPTCSGSGFPACGGTCTAGFICQALQAFDPPSGQFLHGCGCVGETSVCPQGNGDVCTNGTAGRCPPGLACGFSPVSPGPPGGPICGCGDPISTGGPA